MKLKKAPPSKFKSDDASQGLLLPRSDVESGVEAAPRPESNTKKKLTKESRRESAKKEKKRLKDDIWKIFEDVDKARHDGMGRMKALWYVVRRAAARLKEENTRLGEKRRLQQD